MLVKQLERVERKKANKVRLPEGETESTGTSREEIGLLEFH